MMAKLQEYYDVGIDVSRREMLIPFTFQSLGYRDKRLQARLAPILLRISSPWSPMINRDPTAEGVDMGDQVERILMQEHFDPAYPTLTDDQEEIVRNVAPVLYSLMAWVRLMIVSDRRLQRMLPPTPPPDPVSYTHLTLPTKA